MACRTGVQLKLWSRFTLHVTWTKQYLNCWIIFRRRRRITKLDYLASLRQSARLSVCLEKLGSHWTDLSKICRVNSSFIQIQQKYNGYFTWRRFHIHEISRWIFKMENVSGKSCRENQNTVCINPPRRKPCSLGDKVEECIRIGQATADNTMHAFCILGN